MRFLLASFVVLVGCSGEPIRAERVPRRMVSAREELEVERRGMVVHEIEPELHPIIECELGETRRLPVPMRKVGDDDWPKQHCVEYADGSRRFPIVNTPLVVALDDAPVRFTSANAVFPIGLDERTEWVAESTPWLALDRDGSGCIESERELFAGFEKLAAWDANRDGRIDERDAVSASSCSGPIAIKTSAAPPTS